MFQCSKRKLYIVQNTAILTNKHSNTFLIQTPAIHASNTQKLLFLNNLISPALLNISIYIHIISNNRRKTSQKIVEDELQMADVKENICFDL